MKKKIIILIVCTMLILVFLTGCNTKKKCTFDEKIHIKCTEASAIDKYERFPGVIVDNFDIYEEKMICEYLQGRGINPIIAKVKCKQVIHYIESSDVEYYDNYILTDAYTIETVVITDILKSYGNNEHYKIGQEVELWNGYGYIPANDTSYKAEFGMTVEEFYKKNEGLFQVQVYNGYDYNMKRLLDTVIPLTEGEEYILVLGYQRKVLDVKTEGVAYMRIPLNAELYKDIYSNNTDFGSFEQSFLELHDSFRAKFNFEKD